jgi:hypothetical protein
MEGPKLFWVTLALLAGAGCSSVPTISELPATVTIKFGNEIHLTDPDVIVKFVEVIQDSRCPVDVQCVQAGSATLRFSVIEPDGDLFTVLLETGKPPETSDGLTFRLISVDPEPRQGQFLDPGNYSATIEISK